MNLSDPFDDTLGEFEPGLYLHQYDLMLLWEYSPIAVERETVNAGKVLENTELMMGRIVFDFFSGISYSVTPMFTGMGERPERIKEFWLSHHLRPDSYDPLTMSREEIDRFKTSPDCATEYAILQGKLENRFGPPGKRGQKPWDPNTWTGKTIELIHLIHSESSYSPFYTDVIRIKKRR
jgi:hypothetical protein